MFIIFFGVFTAAKVRIFFDNTIFFLNSHNFFIQATF
jgi:hypothetical protein